MTTPITFPRTRSLATGFCLLLIVAGQPLCAAEPAGDGLQLAGPQLDSPRVARRSPLAERTLSTVQAQIAKQAERDETANSDDPPPLPPADLAQPAAPAKSPLLATLPQTEEQAETDEEPAPRSPAERKARDAKPRAEERAEEPASIGQADLAGEEESAAAEQPGAVSLTPEMLDRRDRIRRCLDIYYEKKLNTREHSPWAIMHSLIGFGVDTQLYVDHPGGREVNAIGWLCYNGPGAGLQLFRMNGDRIETPIGPGLQGHQGQFLAMLAQSKVKASYSMQINGRDLTIRDLISHEMYNCEAGTELTFKLIGLSHYLQSDSTWTSRNGEKWDLERLIKEEMAQPIAGAACGGTHRMMGFSYAVNRRQKRNEPLTGQWLRAKKYVDSYIDYTYRLQNPDGSFSTNWYVGPGDSGSVDRKLQTTGHMLEWQVFSVPDDQLDDPRLLRSVDFLTDIMLQGSRRKWEIGPQGHAVHALALYDQRAFGTKIGHRLAAKR